MRRRLSAGAFVLMVCGLSIAGGPADARRVEERSPLFVYLHVVRPIEQDAAYLAEAGEAARAYHGYLQALRGYQALDHSVLDWGAVQPQGLRDLVHEALDRCEAAVAQLRAEAEARDALLLRLNQPVNVDFEHKDLREVCKLLTALTDVNVVVDDTLFPERGPSPFVTIRADRDVPLLQVIRLLAQQKGLAYTIEEDYLYISTRTAIDGQPAFNPEAWFRPQ